MYWYTIAKLTGSGFVHYEISNFARPGNASRHNLIYWRNEDYLGLGPGAHSKIAGVRFNNVEKVESYINELAHRQLPVKERKEMTRTEEISDTVFLALRLSEGLDLTAFEKKFGLSFLDQFGHRLPKLVETGLVKIEENSLKLTEKGLPVANEVFAEFI